MHRLGPKRFQKNKVLHMKIKAEYSIEKLFTDKNKKKKTDT